MNDERKKFRIWDGKKFVLEPRLELTLLNCEPKVCDIALFGKIIQWSTGLKDSKGLDIFEGDIVRVKRCHTEQTKTGEHSCRIDLVEDGEEIGVVCWHDSLFHYWVSFDHIRYDDGENLMCNSSRYTIVGNRYEHPKLIDE